jgi:hypothetical protein
LEADRDDAERLDADLAEDCDELDLALHETYISAKCCVIDCVPVAASLRLQVGQTSHVLFTFAQASPSCGAPLQ